MIFKLRHFIRYPREIARMRRLLDASERWSPERLEAWRRDRLRWTVERAATKVPHYQRMFAARGLRPDDIRDFGDLAALPLLDRLTIAERQAELVASDAAAFDPVSSETSGSTGTPMRFLLDRPTNVLEFAAIWRVLNWAGYRFGDRYASLHGRVLPARRLWQWDWRQNCLHLSSFAFRRENVPRVLERLARFEPRLIKAYPSSLALLARWSLEQGIRPWRPVAVLCGSETLLEHHRAVIQEAFGCPVHDFYGQNERAALISTCPLGRYHVHSEYSHVEVLRPDGSPAGPGEVGEVVTTSLHHAAMPLIRYRTRDLAEVSNEGCPCGRPHPTVARVLGRVEDIVVTPDGRFVGRLDAAFKYSRGIRVSQLVQEQREELVVRIVPTAQFDRAREERILEHHLRERLGDAIAIRFDYTDHIPTGPNGKLKFVVSQVAPAEQLNAAVDLGRAVGLA